MVRHDAIDPRGTHLSFRHADNAPLIAPSLPPHCPLIAPLIALPRAVPTGAAPQRRWRRGKPGVIACHAEKI